MGECAFPFDRFDCVRACVCACAADYDAKKTMCSDSSERAVPRCAGAPSVAPNTQTQKERPEGEKVMKSNRYFPFKVEASLRVRFARGECLS